MAQSDLDAAQTAYDAALAQLNVNQAQTSQAEAGLNQSMVDLNNTVIRSPVDGMVISRNIDVGQTVVQRVDDLVGVASGATGNPAILVYSTRMAPTERPDIGYAMIFPSMTIVKVIAVQIVGLLVATGAG